MIIEDTPISYKCAKFQLITSEIYWIKLGLCEGYDFEKTRSNALPEVIDNFSVYASAHALRLLHNVRVFPG